MTTPVEVSGPPSQGKLPVPVWATAGTGFFYGYLTENDPDPQNRKYEVYLITAKHVAQARGNTSLLVRVNPPKAPHLGLKNSRCRTQLRPARYRGSSIPTQEIDLAATLVNYGLLRDRGFEAEFFPNDVLAAGTDKLREMGTSAGDGVFVLGFPMNLAGVQRNYVIVRQGIIARVSEMLDKAAPTFLVDAFVFPGNSGSPVVLRPEIVAINGTKSQGNAYLIGMVLSYQPVHSWRSVPQTGKPSIVFQENSGLAEVLPDGLYRRSYHGVALPTRFQPNSPTVAGHEAAFQNT